MNLADQLHEARGFVIGAGGLEKPSGDKVNVLPNRIYYLGASSSPKMIFVTSVSGDKVKYRSYPFEQGGDATIEMWIAKDLIQKGSTRQLKTYGKYMEPRLKRSLEDLLNGGNGKPEKLSDWERVYIMVSPGEGAQERGDAYYTAELYGNVGEMNMKGKPGRQLEIHTTRRTLDDIKADKRLKVLKVSKKAFSSPV